MVEVAIDSEALDEIGEQVGDEELKFTAAVNKLTRHKNLEVSRIIVLTDKSLRLAN